MDESIENKIKRTDYCWEWVGAKSGRKGEMYGCYRGKRAHRVVYELLVGKIPDGLHIDHLCRNHTCVNPEHLEPVTNRENILRGFGPTAINARKDKCVNGHPFKGKNLTLVKEYGFIRRRCKACKKEANKRYENKKTLTNESLRLK